MSLASKASSTSSRRAELRADAVAARTRLQLAEKLTEEKRKLHDQQVALELAEKEVEVQVAEAMAEAYDHEISLMERTSPRMMSGPDLSTKQNIEQYMMTVNAHSSPLEINSPNSLFESVASEPDLQQSPVSTVAMPAITSHSQLSVTNDPPYCTSKQVSNSLLSSSIISETITKQSQQSQSPNENLPTTTTTKTQSSPVPGASSQLNQSEPIKPAHQSLPALDTQSTMTSSSGLVHPSQPSSFQPDPSNHFIEKSCPTAPMNQNHVYSRKGPFVSYNVNAATFVPPVTYPYQLSNQSHPNQQLPSTTLTPAITQSFMSPGFEYDYRPNQTVNRPASYQSHININDVPPPSSMFPFLEQPSAEHCVDKVAQSNTQFQQTFVDIANTLARSKLPPLEPFVFKGEATKYNRWRRTMRAHVDSVPIDDDERLSRINKYVTGEPSKLVELYVDMGQSDPTKAYKELWLKLDNRYGQAASETADLEEQIDSFSEISPNDPVKLREFSDLCENISFRINDAELPGLEIFNFPKQQKLVLSKLPAYMRNKWQEKAYKYNKQNRTSTPPFSVLSKFISDVADIKNDKSLQMEKPVTKPKPTSDKSYQQPRNGRYPSAIKALRTESKPTTSWCIYHQAEGHTIMQCRAFQQLDIEARRALLKEHHLCFKCLQPGCGVRTCKAKLHCSICKRDGHLAPMHWNLSAPKGQPKDQAVGLSSNDDVGHESDDPIVQNIETKCTKVCKNIRSRSCSKTILVRFFHSTEPEKSVETYAIVDDQSNRSLIHPHLIEELDLSGDDTQFNLTTCHQLDTPTSGKLITSTVVSSLDGSATEHLPPLFEVENIPSDISEVATPEVAAAWPHLKRIATEIPAVKMSVKVGLLIGRDTPRLHKVRESINGPDNAPWAQKLDMGWTIIGQVCPDPPMKSTRSYFTKTQPTNQPDCKCRLQIQTMKTASEVLDIHPQDSRLGLSIEDNKFLELMNNSIEVNKSGYLEMPLPFRDSSRLLPNNLRMAEGRMNGLRTRLTKNPREKDDYLLFMKNLLQRGHASPIDSDNIKGQPGRVWYLPHFIVYHPKKPHKPGRVVFDSSASYDGVSLNSVLMSGPDLTNHLLGVLLRFRKDNVAVMCDVEQMFHSFYVSQNDRDYLRFLWFEDNDLEKSVISYRMNVHLFGNVSSPAIANFGLRHAADSREDDFEPTTREFVHRSFYVDDGLLSKPTPEEAITTLKEAQAMLASYGIRLHKVISNNPKVLESIPEEDKDSAVQDLLPGFDTIPVQRSLGTLWDPNRDILTMEVPNEPKPATRRGMLSSIHGIYDPFNFAGPVILRGKQIMRELGQTDWDSPVPDDIKQKWTKWLTSLPHLRDIEVPRCFHPPDFTNIVRRELHGFSDASTIGIGSVIYIRTVTADNKVSTTFVKGKCKLAPPNIKTIPRLELEAAVLLVDEMQMVLKELDLPIDDVYYYTDSKVVLGWITNEKRRYHIWVANRIYHIHGCCKPSQFHYIPTNHNPADIASRSVDAERLTNTTWLKGPDHLHELELKQKDEVFTVDEDDPEVKKPKILATQVEAPGEFPSLADRTTKFSTWKSACSAVANLKARRTLHSHRPLPLTKTPNHLNVDDIDEAGLMIIRSLQEQVFNKEIQLLRQKKSLPVSNNLSPLSPFWDDEQEVIRVGGRLSRSTSLSKDERHPILLPNDHHVSRLIIHHYHHLVQHLGRSTTLNELRKQGYWVIGGRGAVAKCILNCLKCRRLRGPFLEQKEADLPIDRTNKTAPFTHVGMDIFGPYQVTVSRTTGTRRANTTVKRWVILYTCLYSRAIHLDILDNMDTDALMNSLRRFICMRGPVNIYRSDQGTNLMSTRKILNLNKAGINTEILERSLIEQNSRWIPNPPHASNFGGVWERMIGTVRRILDNQLMNLNRPLTQDQLATFLQEASNIVNSRPLGLVSTDANDSLPVSPNLILTGKPKSAPPPPGKFTPEDAYARNRWRVVQHLANQFWCAIRKEYLGQLQHRNKSIKPRRNLQIDDVVLMKDEDLPRIQWPMALVNKTYKSEDDIVRKVEVTVVRDKERIKYTRPIGQLVLLMSSDK